MTIAEELRTRGHGMKKEKNLARVDGPTVTRPERATAADNESNGATALLDQVSNRLMKAEVFLEREGYRRYDVLACNCGSWHKW